MEETEYWHEIELHQRLALIGKTVMIGLYEKEGEKFLGAATGRLIAFTESEEEVCFSTEGLDTPTIVYTDKGVAMLSWLANDLKV